MNKARVIARRIMRLTAASLALIAMQNASAVLVDGSVLDFTPVAGSPSSSQPPVGSGSWFAIEPAVFSNYVSLESFQGIRIGSTQPASGSHAGAPDGSENPAIDKPHDWFGNTGMLGSSTPLSLLSASGNSATLDFTGLVWDWNGVDDIRLYDSGAGDSGIATVSCALDCSAGDSYVLDYEGHIYPGDGGMGGEQVLLHLEGTVSAVPLPAAGWLFYSGFAVLLGLTRRRRRAG